MKSRSVHIRDVRKLTADQVWRMRGRYYVTFDDGKALELSGRQIKLSWPYWGVSRYYPEVPTPSTLCYKRGEVSTDDKHLDLMSEAAVLARKAGVDLEDTRYLLSQSVYADSFNLTVQHLISYCGTIDLDTMMQIYNHPDYQIIHEWKELFPTGYDPDGKDMVEEAYKIIENIIYNDPTVRHNPLVMSVIDKTIKLNQVLQAFIRGKTSEIDSRVYSNQVWEGLFGGLHSAAARLKEAGATSRSHLYNTDNIAAAEYASRKFQLIANVLMSFTYEDCGTEHAHYHTFRDTDQQRELYKASVGMYYRPEGSKGEWLRFEHDGFDDLIGKPIEFRSAMTCKGMSKQIICAKCMGDLVYNLSLGTSPGHLASTSISEKGTQGILSTKHLDFVRKLLNLILSPDIRDYVCEYRSNSMKGLCLNKKPQFGAWSEYKLVIQDRMFSEISQVAYHETLEDIDETALPEVTDLIFRRYDNDGLLLDEQAIDVRMGVCGNFSKAFLHYFLRNRDNLVFDKRVVEIPLNKFKTDQPVIVYTNRTEPMAEFVAGLETKIRSAAVDKNDEDYAAITVPGGVKANKKGKVKQMTLVQFGGATEEQCTAALFDTYKYINRKLKGIPLTHVATMLAISRVESPTNAFPAVGFDKESTPDGKQFVDHNTLIGMRSAAPMFFFEKQQGYLDNVSFYTVWKRPASLYDGSFSTLETFPE